MPPIENKLVDWFKPDVIKKAFKKSQKQLTECSKLFEENQADAAPTSANLSKRDFSIDIGISGLHFLFKGAKIPFVNTTSPPHLPFWDYLEYSSNDYYRADGGNWVKECEQKLGNKYCNDWNIFLVKHNTFEMLCRYAYKESSGTIGADFTIFSPEDSMDNQGLLDATHYIDEDHLVKWQQWQGPVVGLVDLGHNLGLLLTLKNEGAKFEYSLEEMRGTLGAFPEALNLKRVMLEKNSTYLKQVLATYPRNLPLTVPNKPDPNSTSENETPLAKLTLSLTQCLLEQISIQPTNPYKDRQTDSYNRAFENFQKQIGKLEAARTSSFQAILERFSLVAEAFIRLLVFYPNPIKPTENEYFYNSGMSAIAYAITAAVHEFKNPSLVLLESSYYEIKAEWGLKSFLEQYCNIEEQTEEALQKRQNPCDIIFLDLYPNEVTLKTAQAPNTIQIVEQMFQKGAKKLVIIIDTSTTYFWSEEIQQKLVTPLQKYINEGKLALVTVNSLAKFAMGGLDKYTGGHIKLFHKQNAFANLSARLAEARDQDTLSEEGAKFFHMISQYAKIPLQNLYYNVIRSNTNFLYNELIEKGFQLDDSLIYLAKRDDTIPMLGFHFKQIDEDQMHSFLVLVQHYCQFYALKKGLPLLIRGSFGFLHSAVSECQKALRLTVGLEEQNDLLSYVKLFVNLRNELKSADCAALIAKEPEVLNRLCYQKHAQNRWDERESFQSFLEQLNN